MADTAQAMQQAVEALMTEIRPYANVMEGYGDMCYQMLGIQSDAKELKKLWGEVADTLHAEQELPNVLRSVEVQAMRLAGVALGMAAKARRFAAAALPYGDLLAMAEGDGYEQGEA